MRKLLIAGILMVLAIPAAASDCQSLTFDGGYITGRSGNTDLVRTGLIGSNLLVQVGEYTGQDEYEGTITHQVPASAVGATVCPDGSVSFEQAAVVAESEPVEEPAELLTESEVEELRPETRANYIATHPGTGGLQEF